MKKQRMRLTAWLLSLAMLLTVVPGFAITAGAAEGTCTCETDDPAIHAVGCAAYVAPEHPACGCVEKCTEPNLWCDICGFDVTACEGGADEGVPYAEYTLWVGDQKFTDGYLTISDDNGGTATYDPDSNTLTLENFTCESTTGNGLRYNGGGTLTLVLNGENSITQTSNTSECYGVKVENSNLSIKGNGSLTINSADSSINSSRGVTASGSITISDACRLEVNVGDSADDYSNYGVRAGSDITVSGNSSLIVTAGTAVGTQSVGVWAEGSITVSDNASLEAESGEAQWSYGVYAPLSVSVSGNGKLTATGGTATGDSCESIGVYSGVTVSGNGSLKATGVTATNGSSYGVYAQDYGGMTVEGGTVEAQGNDGALDVTPSFSTDTHAVYDNNGEVIDSPVWANLTYAKIAEKGYAITISPSENGTVIANKATADENDTVTLTVEPAEGYVLDTLTVTGESGAVATTAGEDNTYTFTMPASNVTVTATYRKKVNYIDKNGDEQTAYATPITDQTTELTDGWYIVDSDVTIGTRITVQGNVHLILADGATLTVNGGIEVNENNSLTIYGQEAGTGTLVAEATTNNNAGIGGTGGASGQITINGGTVKATGGKFGAGIGGGQRGSGEVTINGGTVQATGGTLSAGIGGGDGGSGTVKINGGTVTAKGGNSGAGIGGGSAGIGGIGGGARGTGTVTINGGSVTATGGSYGAGIGGGDGGSGTVKINGGSVTAKGGTSGAGIGGGYGGSGTVTIEGGTVNATGGEGADGDINGTVQNGGGDTLNRTTITLADGVVPSTLDIYDQDGNKYTFGTKDMELSGGVLYLYVPADISRIDVNGIEYPCNREGVWYTAHGDLFCTGDPDNGGRLNAFCAGCKTALGTATITAESKIFDGRPAVVTVSGTGCWKDSAPAVQYRTDDGKVLAEGSAPVEKGTYFAFIEYGGVQASVEVTITCLHTDTEIQVDGGSIEEICTNCSAVMGVIGIVAPTRYYNGEAQEVIPILIGTLEGAEVTLSYAIAATQEAVEAMVDANVYTVTLTYEGYTISREMTITPCPVFVEVDDAQKTYGDADPAFTHQILGMPPEGEDPGVTFTREGGEDAGTYIITAALSNPNYVLYGCDPGVLTIAPRVAELVWDNTSLEFNGERQGPVASVSNLLEGDSCTVTVSSRGKYEGSFTALAVALDNPNYVLPEDASVEYTIWADPYRVLDDLIPDSVKAAISEAISEAVEAAAAELSQALTEAFEEAMESLLEDIKDRIGAYIH